MASGRVPKIDKTLIMNLPLIRQDSIYTGSLMVSRTIQYGRIRLWRTMQPMSIQYYRVLFISRHTMKSPFGARH